MVLSLFDGLGCYTQGKNLVHLIDRQDENYCFRLHRDRVYYLSESAMRMAISVARPNLVSLGTCFGKFSKSGKFKLHITALDYLAQYAKYKVSSTISRYFHILGLEPYPVVSGVGLYTNHFIVRT